MEVRFDNENSNVWIPICSQEEIRDFQKSLINVLDKVEIDNCNPEFREDLARVYRLLSLLVSASKSLSKEQQKTERELSESIQKITA